MDDNHSEAIGDFADSVNEALQELKDALSSGNTKTNHDGNTFSISLSSVHQIAQSGLSDTVFKVGDIIISTHKDGEITWIVTHAYRFCINLHMKYVLKEGLFFGETNDWETSDIRKWLNDAENGFLSGFPRADADAISPVQIVTVKNGKPNTTLDKLYLLSRNEVGLGKEKDTSEGEPSPYYDSGEKRQKTDAYGNRRWYWLRSPGSGNANFVRIVGASGALDRNYAVNSNGVAAACTIR